MALFVVVLCRGGQILFFDGFWVFFDAIRSWHVDLYSPCDSTANCKVDVCESRWVNLNVVNCLYAAVRESGSVYFPNVCCLCIVAIVLSRLSCFWDCIRVSIFFFSASTSDAKVVSTVAKVGSSCGILSLYHRTRAKGSRPRTARRRCCFGSVNFRVGWITGMTVFDRGSTFIFGFYIFCSGLTAGPRG